MKNLYEHIWQKGSGHIRAGSVLVDPFLSGKEDHRRALSVIVRLSSPLTDALESFARQAQQVEPNLYGYTREQLHVTVFTIISCASPVVFDHSLQQAYRDIVRACADHTEPFSITFNGVTASRSCIMAQGFVESDSLQRLRALLTRAFHSSDLPHSIGARETGHLAHATLLRFKKPLEHPEPLIEFLARHRTTAWGTVAVSAIELVHNDWFHQPHLTEPLLKTPVARYERHLRSFSPK